MNERMGKNTDACSVCTIRLVVAIDIDAVVAATAFGVNVDDVVGIGDDDLAGTAASVGSGDLGFQCLSYLIPNKTIKYSISAKNTNSVQDINHTLFGTGEKRI